MQKFEGELAAIFPARRAAPCSCACIRGLWGSYWYRGFNNVGFAPAFAEVYGVDRASGHIQFDMNE